MDTGTYNNIRRGASPLVPTNTATPSYKTNVNRTKTRKWVEARTNNYDGDDWGNDYDDEDEEEDESEPPPPPMPLQSRTTGLRQVGQSAASQLPSNRIFSQPAATSSQNMAGNSSAMRTPSGPPALQVQTQPAAPPPTPPHSFQSGLPSVSQSAGPQPTPARYPPRKSSMGQQDRPDISGQIAPSSANDASTTTKGLPFVRPADIYKRMEEEKEKERMSMESGRPSMDRVLGRSEGTSSPSNARLSGEHRRRVSSESHDDSESARGVKTMLPSVAERKSEYGMEGLLANYQPQEKSIMSSDLPQLSPELVDEATKADLVQSRRYSTSPQLPSLSRMSGFGDDWFGGSPTKVASPLAPPVENDIVEEEPYSGVNEQKVEPEEISNGSQEAAAAGKKLQPSTRPSLPGTWVSETTTIASEQPTPFESRGAPGSTPLAQVENASSPSGSDMEAGAVQTDSQDGARLSTSKDSVESKSDSVNTIENENTAALDTISTGADRRSLPPLDTGNLKQTSRPTSMIPPADQTPGSSATEPKLSAEIPEPHPPADFSGFYSTAPLDPRRSSGILPDVVRPSANQRQSTLDTIETASPQKESDKLREEIIQSLSPTPLSPGADGSPSDHNQLTPDPSPGNLTRESTYLSGVYDEYLSIAEEKSLREVSQSAKQSAQHTPSQTPQQFNNTTMAQPRPLSPAKNTPISIDTSRPRRFSWEQGAEEVTLSPTGAEPSTVPSIAPVPQLDTQLASPSPPQDPSYAASAGGLRPMTHQVSDASSRGPGDSSLAPIDTPSPVSQVTAKSPDIGSFDQSNNRLSFAHEKEKFLTETVRETTPSGEHPAFSQLQQAPEPTTVPQTSNAPDVSISTQQAPMGFRDILNIESRERRIQKLDETREQFYMMDSGLSNWVMHMQSLPDASTFDHPPQLLNSKTGIQTGVTPAPGSSSQPLLYYQQMINASKNNLPSTQPRRTSMGNVQQLMQGQSSVFNSSGGLAGSNQVGAKSKELLHAAGAFGNKGVKSGMKLFNKGKSKLRERAK